MKQIIGVMLGARESLNIWIRHHGVYNPQTEQYETDEADPKSLRLHYIQNESDRPVKVSAELDLSDDWSFSIEVQSLDEPSENTVEESTAGPVEIKPRVRRMRERVRRLNPVPPTCSTEVSSDA